MSCKVKLSLYIFHTLYYLLVSHVLHINLLLFIFPAQENGFDCGMFVCHDAFSIYCLQDVDIKFADVVKEQPSHYFRFNKSESTKFCAEVLLSLK